VAAHQGGKLLGLTNLFVTEQYHTSVVLLYKLGQTEQQHPEHGIHEEWQEKNDKQGTPVAQLIAQCAHPHHSYLLPVHSAATSVRTTSSSRRRSSARPTKSRKNSSRSSWPCSALSSES